MLRVLIYGPSGWDVEQDALLKHDVEVCAHVTSRDELIEASAEAKVEVALLLLDEADDRQSWKQLAEPLKSRGICVVAAINGADTHPKTYLDEGFDAVVPQTAEIAVLSDALWSAHWGFRACQDVAKQLVEARGQMERGRLIEQAKTIMASQMGITEAAALRTLRREARNRRRSMEDLAKIVLQAHDLIADEGLLEPSQPESE